MEWNAEKYYMGADKGGCNRGYATCNCVEYSCSCCMNPKFGFATPLLLFMYSTAWLGDQPYSATRNAATTLTLLLTPSTQWTSTWASWWELSASRMKEVVFGKWATSSANGKSSSLICIRMGWSGRSDGGGRKIASGRVERICVIRYNERRVGFSAKARSEIYSRGIISSTLRTERVWVGGGNGGQPGQMVIWDCWKAATCSSDCCTSESVDDLGLDGQLEDSVACTRHEIGREPR